MSYNVVTKHLPFDLSGTVINCTPILLQDVSLSRNNTIIHFENEFVSSRNCFGQWFVYIWYYGNSVPLIMDNPQKVYNYIINLQNTGYKQI